MSVHIDSSEVLHHLKNYGIRSIDDNSLKSFIKDLKKLIKYEHYRNVYGAQFDETNPSREQNFTKPLTQDDSSSNAHDNLRKKSCCRKKHKENIRPVFSEQHESDQTVQRREMKCECSCKAIHAQPGTRCTGNTEDINAQKTLCKCKRRVTDNAPDEKSATDKLREEACNMKRPTSLLSCTRSQATSVRNKKGHCDPVELYHYYQSFWKNHKLPGENDHAQLRLAVRKRLMNAK